MAPPKCRLGKSLVSVVPDLDYHHAQDWATQSIEGGVLEQLRPRVSLRPGGRPDRTWVGLAIGESKVRTRATWDVIQQTA
jgi:hypothetical protein